MKEFLERKKNWIETKIDEPDGDHNGVVFTNKKDNALTVEMHTTDNSDNLEDDDDTVYNSWYIYPARNGKGLWNAPNGIDESSGYTRADAIKELEEILVETDEEME